MRKSCVYPKSESGEGKTPALGDHQARKLLAAPADDSTRGKRDRAILSTLLFHALRRDELCKLKVRNFRHARKGVPHLKVSGKGGKVRYLPLHPGTNALIHEYLEAAGHGEDDAGALFRPIRNNRTGKLDGAITPDGVYRLVRAYSAALGFEIGAHALRAMAQAIEADRSLRWQVVQRGYWVNGVSTLGDYMRSAAEFTLEGRAERIRFPTLLTTAERDPVGKAAQSVFEALTCPKELVRFTAFEGAGEHCEILNRSPLNRRVFDWLDGVMQA